ncbi:succinate dehydrogenase, hydrophobic membrane anchor protein [Allosphingosinicella sp.]|uniref:succinate dehydrogenase, hydrophobic membrane anchor protein n=1 Tax=Allosphingosinicella sp. TaxID=2823234 RepID=UPI003783E0EB
MRTSLGRVRGLGSARSGATHWWHERLTSVSTLILLVWFFVSLVRLPDLSYATVTQWLAKPLAAVPMLLLILSVFWHLASGLRVVVEDYVHEEGGKLFWLVAINFACLFAAALSIFAVLRIAFGGGA